VIKNVTSTCKTVFLQIPFLAISFPCRFNFIFPGIFRSLQIPHIAKSTISLPFSFPCKFHSLHSEATRFGELNADNDDDDNDKKFCKEMRKKIMQSVATTDFIIGKKLLSSQ